MRKQESKLTVLLTGPTKMLPVRTKNFNVLKAFPLLKANSENKNVLVVSIYWLESFLILNLL